MHSAREVRIPIGTSRCGFFGFLRVRGNGVESDVRKEHDRRTEHDPGEAVGRKRTSGRIVDRQEPTI